MEVLDLFTLAQCLQLLDRMLARGRQLYGYLDVCRDLDRKPQQHGQTQSILFGSMKPKHTHSGIWHLTSEARRVRCVWYLYDRGTV
jgi:hypothetical protein